MRRIVTAVMVTLSGLVLLFAYPTSTNRTAGVAGGTLAPAAQGAGSAGSGTTSGGTSSGSGGTSSGSAASGTYTGGVAQTRWGPVQVRIEVSGGRITSADAVQYPSGNGHDQQINAYALPILTQEAIAAQSSRIDMVSGATVTSEGYVSSLQDAIDQAFG